jgi:putative ABC transport system permease protein
VTFAGLAAKNALRNKVRVALTIVGVAIAILSFVLLRTVSYAWTSGAEFAAKDRIVTHHKITFVMPLPKRYIENVRNAPHVKVATWGNWFGGKDPLHEHEFFQTLGVDEKTWFTVYDDVKVPPDQMQTFLGDKSGTVVGDVLMKKMGWQVGQKIMLETGIYPTKDGKPWQFTIDGVYTTTSRAVDRSSLFFHWDYMNDNLPAERQNLIGWVVSRVDDPAHTADVSAQLDKTFDDRDPQTTSQDEATFRSSFLATFSAVLNAIDVISFVILVIMLLILGNTIAMGVRERTNEYGVLRAMGFLPRHLAGFILGESTIVGAVGGALGVALVYPMVEKGMSRWIEENFGTLFPHFHINPRDVVLALVLGVALGALAAAVPAYRASKLHVVDALRRVA